MSFDGEKKRLVAELAEAQAAIRAQYGLAKREATTPDGKPAPKPGTGKRESPKPESD